MPLGGVQGNLGKLRGKGPAADAQSELKRMLALDQVELLHVAIKVFTRFIPTVTLPVLISVGPGVREEDSAVLTDIGKGIQDVGKVGSRDAGGGKGPCVDGPGGKVAS